MLSQTIMLGGQDFRSDWFPESCHASRTISCFDSAICNVKKFPVLCLKRDGFAFGKLSDFFIINVTKCAINQANIFGTEQDRVNCSFYYKVSI